MKKTSLLLVLMTITVFGQNQSRLVQNKTIINNVDNNSIESVPRRISYQGLITKADGSPTEDGSYEVLFRVYNSADGGDPIWSEAQEVSVINGIISTVLGNTNPFTTIPQEAFLELSVEGSTLSPRQLLTSVFYSILSDTSGYAKTADYDNLINLPDLDVYVMKDSLESYTTSAELYDTLAVYQQLDSNLTDLTEDGVLSGSKVEYGITSPGTNGQSWISDGDGSGEWGTPTGLAADGIVSVGSLTLDSGTITDESGAISFGDENLSTTGTLSAETGSSLGNITLADGSITAGGNISFGDENLSTTGTLNTGIATLASTSTIGDITLANGSITDEGGSISFGNENLTTTGTLSAGVATLGAGSEIGDITLSDGSITSSSDTISFGNDAISTSGTLSSGTATLATGSTVGNLTLADGSITDSDGSISFGDNDLSTNGSINSGRAVLGSNTTIGSLTLSDGFITDTGGSISFDDENISTTGTLNSGTATLATGSTIGNLTLADGSITDAGGSISFDDVNLTTEGIITANSFSGDGSNLTGVEASSTGTLSGATPIILEGEIPDSAQTTLSLVEPTTDRTITFPDVTGTVLTTGNESTIDQVGTIASGTWQGTAVADTYVADDLTISGGTINNTIIGGTAPVAGTFTTLTGSSADVGTVNISDGLITDSGGTISFDNENLNTSGTLASGSQTVTGNVTASDTVSAEQLTSTDDLTVADQASIDGTLTLATGSITDSDGAIDFGNENLSTSGTLASGSQTVTGNVTVADQASIDGTLTLATGSITDSGGTISFDNENLNTSGTLASGSQTVTGNVTVSATVSAEQLTSTDDLTVGDDLNLASDAAVLSLGEDGDVTLTHVQDTGILLGDSRQMQFRDNALKISSTIDGQLDIDADTEVEITANTVDLNGALDVLGNVTVGESLQTATIGYTDGDLAITISDGGAVTTSGDLTVGGTISGGNITASSIEADNIVAGDGAVSISTSFGAITLTSAAALNLNPATGSAIVLDGTVNVDAGVVTGATSITSVTQVASTSLQTPLIEYTDGDDAMTIADGGAVTFGQEAQFSSGIQTAGSIETATIDYTDGDLAITIVDGGAITTSGNATVSGNATITGDLTITGNDATFGNGESISNVTDGTIAITAPTTSVSGDLSVGTSLQTGTIDYTDGDLAITISDGGAVTTSGDLTVGGTISGGNITASSLMANDIETGDDNVTITTSSGKYVAVTSGALAPLTLTSGAALNLNPATGSAIVLDGTVNVDAGVVTGATSITSVTQVASTSLQTPLIEYTDGDDAMTIADGGAVTFSQEAQFSGGVQTAGSIETATIDYTNGDVAMTIADGGAVTFAQEAQFSGGVQTEGSIETATIDYTDGDLAITIADGGDITTSGNATITGDLTVTGNDIKSSSATAITLSGANVTVAEDLTVTGDDIAFGNGETISNSTDGTVLITSLVTSLSGDLTVTGNDLTFGNGEAISNSTDGTVTITSPTTSISADLAVAGLTTANANIAVKNGATSAGKINFYEDSNDGTEKLVMLANSMSSDVTLTLPANDGDANQVLKTDGSGVMSWVDVSASIVTITDNENTSETNALVFTAGGDVDGGSLGLESDGDATYNPSTGVISSTGYSGSTIVASTSLDITGSTGLILENDETITNSTDGTVLITSPTTSLSGDLTVTGNDLAFGNGETISNSTDGTVLITAPTTTVSAALTVTGDLTVTGNDITFGNGEVISNSTDGTVLIDGIVSGGSGSAQGVFTSNSNQDVILRTGNSTTGSITITDGADGNMALHLMVLEKWIFLRLI